MNKPTLSKALEGKFKMATGCNPGSYIFAGRKIDTSSCDLKEAEQMHALGMKELVKIEPVAPNESGKGKANRKKN